MKKSQISAIIHEAIKDSTNAVYKNANTHQITSLPKDSYAYQKYIKPIKDRESELSKKNIKEWFLNNLLALIALGVSIFALFK